VGVADGQAAEKVRQRRSLLIKILNVPRGYASGFDSLAALLDGLFEHPAGYSPVAVYVRDRGILVCRERFLATE